MCERLIIVGNGFDLHHHMKTSYIDYRNYLIKSGKKNVVDIFEKYSEEHDKNWMWNSLETNLAFLNFEGAYPLLTEYENEEWSDSSNHDFQYEILNLTTYWPEIKVRLKDWICQIKYGTPDKKLVNIINNQSYFLSFNYTNTLENLYNINSERICYIHGNAQQEDELILGHNENDWVPEWEINEDCDIRLIEASTIMNKHLEKTKKPVDKIINKNKKFLSSNFDSIYVIGLSYNEIDKIYLNHISQTNPNAEWNFYYYSQKDKDDIAYYAKSINAKNYSITKFEDM